MGMSLQTAIHAFCFALTLSVHTVASQRKFCFIHAYILIACSFLEASKRNIYHFVSHLCLESICSISGCRREQLLAPIQYQPPWHMFIYLHLTSDSISNALTIPFRSPYVKKPHPKPANKYLAFTPNIHICLGWFHPLQQHNTVRVLSDPNNSLGPFGTKLDLNEEKWGYLGYVNPQLLPSPSNNHQTPYWAALLVLSPSFLPAWLRAPFSLDDCKATV